MEKEEKGMQVAKHAGELQTHTHTKKDWQRNY